VSTPRVRLTLVSIALVATVFLTGVSSPQEVSTTPAAATRPLRSEAVSTTTTAPPPPPPTTTTTIPPTTTTEPPEPQPEPERAEAPQPFNGSGDPYDLASWYRLYECENGGYGWSANTGNGFYGGLQFSLSSWASVGGAGRPDQASPDEQIHRGQLLWEQGGWAHWPACTRSFGWR
jgi:hypothetical protein